MHTHTHTLTLPVFHPPLFSCLIYIPIKLQVKEIGSLGGTQGEKHMTEVISAVLGRSVKGQTFPSPGCVNHINTLTETLPLRTRLQPSSGAHTAGATLLHTTLYCGIKVFCMEMLLYVLNVH